MKIAKVNPVYEGKISGGREEDEEEEAGRSRMARENAKARIRNIRRVSVRAWRPHQRRMVTRSMAAMSSSSLSSSSVPLDTIKEDEEEEEDHQEMNNNNNNDDKGKEVVELNEKEKQEGIVIDVDEIEDKPQAEVEVPAVPGGADGVREEFSWPNGWYDGLDDWPMTWSYEEEWLWSGRGLGFGLTNPQWQYIEGVGWIDKRP